MGFTFSKKALWAPTAASWCLLSIRVSMVPDIASYAANRRLTSGRATIHLRSAAGSSVRPIAPRLPWLPLYSAHVPDQWPWRKSLFWTCDSMTKSTLWKSLATSGCCSSRTIMSRNPTPRNFWQQSIVTCWQSIKLKARTMETKWRNGQQKRTIQTLDVFQYIRKVLNCILMYNDITITEIHHTDAFYLKSNCV